MIPGAVVGDPVKDHLDAQGMGLLDQLACITQAAEFRVHGPVVADRVIAAEAALAIELADRLQRHQPDQLDTHFFQSWQLRSKGLDRAFRRVLAQVHLVDADLVRPGHMGHFSRRILTHGEVRNKGCCLVMQS